MLMDSSLKSPEKNEQRCVSNNNIICQRYLPPESVRWFFGTVDGDATKSEPFGGYDSIRLETKYRESIGQSKCLESLSELVVVRDGLFEANLRTGNCLPIYWESKEMQINPESKLWMNTSLSRGAWFRKDTWKPLPENLSKIIEDAFLEQVLPNLIAKKDLSQKLQVLYSLPVERGFVRFMDDGSVYLDANAALHYFRTKFTMKNGLQLNRGYKELSNIEDKAKDISHLVFVVHGTGQAFGSITKDTWKIRSMCKELHEANFNATEQRTEFLPVEWRTTLPIDESVIQSVTITHCQPLRILLNSAVLDILYYTSPLHRMEIMRAFYLEVTRLYSMFCSRNPYFEANGGQVSILAHSLGAVVAFDVLTGSTPSCSHFYYMKSMEETFERNGQGSNILEKLSEGQNQLIQIEKELMQRKPGKIPRGNPRLREAKLPSNFKSGEFWKPFPKIANLFCLGSPLAVFLALRGVTPLPSLRTSVMPIVPSPLTQPPVPHAAGDSDIDSPTVPPRGFPISNGAENGIMDEKPSNQSAGNACENGPSFNGIQNNVSVVFAPPPVFPPFPDERHLCYGNVNFRLFNIFHPRDPVAYRIEPLIFQHYVDIKPAIVGNPNVLKKHRGPPIPDQSAPPLCARSVKWPTPLQLANTATSQNSRWRNDFARLSTVSVTSSVHSESSSSQSETTPDETPSIQMLNSNDSPSAAAAILLSPNASKIRSSTPSSPRTPSAKRTSACIAMNWLAAYLKRVQPAHLSSLTPICADIESCRVMPRPSERRLTDRIDFEIEEEPMQNILWGLFTSHRSYWTCEALGLFLLTRIHGAPQINGRVNRH